MAKLVMSLDGVVLKEHELTKERTTIGRKPHNDIQIDNLAISGEHAVIVTILNDSFLQDLDSTNGTQVNGRPVKKHFLQDDDVIELAKYKIKFIGSAPTPSKEAEQQDTLVLRSEEKSTASAATKNGGAAAKAEDRDEAKNEADLKAAVKAMASQEPAGSAAGAHAAGATGFQKPAGGATGFPKGTSTVLPGSAGVQFLTGPDAGREIELTKNLTTIGKPGTHLAVIARRKNGYFLTHVEGDTFPSINGRMLDAKAHPLTNHDIIELGGVKIEFFINP